MGRKAKWSIGIAAGLVAVVTALFFAASKAAKRIEPYLKEQTTSYLSKRFKSEVEIGTLQIDIPRLPPLRMLFTKGEGVIAQVTGRNIVLRHKGRRDIPPLFTIGKFHFSADAGRIFDPRKKVALVEIDAMEIHVPPRGEKKTGGGARVGGEAGQADSATPADDIQNQVVLERVLITNSKLVILPRSKDRKPLEFALHRVALSSVQLKESLQYEAELTNPKPPGTIRSSGSFGPWNSESPSETSLAGNYTFQNADLGVFPAIDGTLNSSGTFSGNLGAVEAKGEAEVLDFRLRMAGNKVPLHTRYEALVDGTNGNTTLKPVHATLGSTSFVTAGTVFKHDGDTKRTIELTVHIADGEVMDLLRLTSKSKPFMSGRISMNSKILIPPLQQKVAEKLILDGKFSIRRGMFLQENVQDKVDSLSRRGMGQPKNHELDNAFSNMAGKFRLDDQLLAFETLTYDVPGASVDLAGKYDMAADELDFAGALKLKAKVSQTMTGWKRWVLKPVDPFFAKNGAGTFLKIKVTGSSKDPGFGLRR